MVGVVDVLCVLCMKQVFIGVGVTCRLFCTVYTVQSCVSICLLLCNVLFHAIGCVLAAVFYCAWRCRRARGGYLETGDKMPLS